MIKKCPHCNRDFKALHLHLKVHKKEDKEQVFIVRVSLNDREYQFETADPTRCLSELSETQVKTRLMVEVRKKGTGQKAKRTVWGILARRFLRDKTAIRLFLKQFKLQ